MGEYRLLGRASSEDPIQDAISRTTGHTVAVSGDVVQVAIGEPVVLEASIPISSIRGVERTLLQWPTPGVHGWRGHWTADSPTGEAVRIEVRGRVFGRLSLGMPAADARVKGFSLAVMRLIGRARWVRIRSLTVQISSPDVVATLRESVPA